MGQKSRYAQHKSTAASEILVASSEETFFLIIFLIVATDTKMTDGKSRLIDSIVVCNNVFHPLKKKTLAYCHCFVVQRFLQPEEKPTETPAAEETPKEEAPADKQEEPAKEEDKKEDPAKEDDAAPTEKKSIFAMICGCMGGSAPPTDTDPAEKEVNKVDTVDAEKEEVAEEAAPPETAPATEAPVEVTAS